jgi:anti-sigma B factor antagonist
MISIEKRDKIDIISFSVNNINALITDEIREGITRVFDIPNSKVIIDLKGVEYIDSSGFGCFLSVMKAARNNYGILKFANPEQRVMELFKVLHLHTVFQIFEDMDTCLSSFK